jgi:predicted RNase H-like nuclease (RuvC/YqgF family)
MEDTAMINRYGLEQVQRDYNPDHDIGPSAPVHWSVARLAETVEKLCDHVDQLEEQRVTAAKERYEQFSEHVFIQTKEQLAKMLNEQIAQVSELRDALVERDIYIDTLKDRIAEQDDRITEFEGYIDEHNAKVVAALDDTTLTHRLECTEDPDYLNCRAMDDDGLE